MCIVFNIVAYPDSAESSDSHVFDYEGGRHDRHISSGVVVEAGGSPIHSMGGGVRSQVAGDGGGSQSPVADGHEGDVGISRTGISFHIHQCGNVHTFSCVAR